MLRQVPTTPAQALAADMANSVPVMCRGRLSGVITFVTVEQARAELGCEPTGEWQTAGRYEYKLASEATLEAAAEELIR